MIDTGVRAHIGRVTGNLAAALAFSAAAAALAYPLVQRLPHTVAMRGTIIAVLLVACLVLSRHIRLNHKTLIATGAINTTRLSMIGYAALIGLISALGFAATSDTSIAGVFVVAAAAFAVASLWGCGMKRELPRWLPAWAENVIVVEIVIVSGAVFAMLMELVAWPNGIDYVKYAAGLLPTPPAEAGAEWASSFALTAYLALALAFYARTIRPTYEPSWHGDINTVPRASLAPLWLLPSPFAAVLPLLSIFICNPALAGYLPLGRPRDKAAESHVGVLGAFAVYSSIPVPLAIAVIIFWANPGS
jgi:hypothetical protein